MLVAMLYGASRHRRNIMPFDAAPQKPEPSVPQCSRGVGLTQGLITAALAAFIVAALIVRWWPK
jgi:hypothetical protein